MGVAMAKGTPRKSKAPGFEGYRVFRIEVNAALRQALAELYIAIVRALQSAGSVPKGLLYYGEEFGNMVHAAVLNRFKAGKRTPPEKLPPIPLLVRFRWGGRGYGARSAVCVIDLDRCLLRIWTITVPLPLKLCEVLRGELELAPPPTFTLFLCQDGELRLVVCRSPPKWWVAVREECDDYTDFYFPRPFAAVGVDVNSGNGVTIMAFEITDSGVKRILRRRLRPPRRGRRLVGLLRSYSDLARNIRGGRGGEWQRSRLRRAYEEVRELPALQAPTPSACERLARQKERANTARVRAWERELSKIIRDLARAHGGRVVVFVDKPSPESLKGKPWQQSLLRVARRLRTTTLYEGGYYREVRVSGKHCPLCGERGVPYSPEGEGRRASYFYCQGCGIAWNRDYCSSFIAVLEGTGLANELKGWLRKHPEDLLGSATPPTPPTPGLRPPGEPPIPGRGRALRSAKCPGAPRATEGESSRDALRQRGAERREQAALRRPPP
ncbi:MAG: hypothetical protein QW185_01050 [Thermofilum sp.]